MPNYKWKQQQLCGIIEANNLAHAKVKLLLQNIYPDKIWRDYSLSFSKKHLQQKIDDEIIQQLSIILSAKVTIEQAFNILLNSNKHPTIIFKCQKIMELLQQGNSLAAALEKSTSLPKYQLTMIDLASSNEKMTEILASIHHHIEQRKKIIAQIQKASFYPLVLLSSAIVIFLIILYYVLPSIKQFYQINQAALPSSTLYLLAISTISKTMILSLIVLLLIAAWFFNQLLKFKKIRFHYHKLFTQLPLIKSLFLYYYLSTLFHFLYDLLNGGFLLADAWHQAGLIIENNYIKYHMQQVAQLLEEGKTFYQAISLVKIFPPFVCTLCQMGEETGQLTTIFSKLAMIYKNMWEKELEKKIRWLEPILLLMMTSIIGFILLSIYTPLFNLGMVM